MRQSLYNALCSIAREVYSVDLAHLHLPPVNASGVEIRTFAQDVVEYLRRKGEGKSANMANLLMQLQNTLRRYDDRVPVNQSGATATMDKAAKTKNSDNDKDKGNVK